MLTRFPFALLSVLIPTVGTILYFYDGSMKMSVLSEPAANLSQIDVGDQRTGDIPLLPELPVINPLPQNVEGRSVNRQAKAAKVELSAKTVRTWNRWYKTSQSQHRKNFASDLRKTASQDEFVDATYDSGSTERNPKINNPNSVRAMDHKSSSHDYSSAILKNIEVSRHTVKNPSGKWIEALSGEGVIIQVQGSLVSSEDADCRTQPLSRFCQGDTTVSNDIAVVGILVRASESRGKISAMKGRLQGGHFVEATPALYID